MKFEADTAALLAELQTVARVASTRSAVQALSGVQVVAAADSEGVELRATDMEMGLRVHLPAAVQRPGEFVVPARLVLDIARSLPAQTTTLELRPTEQDVEIISGASTFHIRPLRSEDFPPLPEPAAEGTLTVPAREFVDTIGLVARSAGRDETRPVLTGILVSAQDSGLRMVATDSYRLSVKETALDSPLSGGFEANVPARTLQELARIAQQEEAETVSVSALANQVVFGVGGVRLSSRLIEGQFPNYRQLLPESVEHELHVSGGELTEVVRRVSLLATRPHDPLRLSFREGEVTVSAQSADVGEASEALPIDFHGEPMEIGFNPGFLRDGLESVESGDLVLKLISPLRPGLIESADGSGFVYLIMPIRLNV